MGAQTLQSVVTGYRKELIGNVSFHRLPIHGKELIKKWIIPMKLKDPKVNIHSRICSDHLDDCFVQGKHRRKLKSGVVPSKFVFNTHRTCTEQSLFREKHLKSRLESRKLAVPGSHILKDTCFIASPEKGRDFLAFRRMLL